jgi:hypothetical protein
LNREYAEGYLKGYEEGLREALEEIIAMTCRKSYTSTEIQLLAKNQRVSVPKKMTLKKGELERLLGIDLDAKEENTLEPAQEAAPGKTVLIKGEGNQEALEDFRDLVRAGWDGLCISRMCPREVRQFVGKDCTVLWLTKADPMAGDQEREEYLLPTETAKMQTCIRNFLSIITNTDFRSFLKIAQKLKDDVNQARSLLLLPYEPKNLPESEVNLLINEMS